MRHGFEQLFQGLELLMLGISEEDIEFCLMELEIIVLLVPHTYGLDHFFWLIEPQGFLSQSSERTELFKLFGPSGDRVVRNG